MFSETKREGTEKIGDHMTDVVVGQREGKPPIRLYFDEQSGLLVRLVRYGDTALGLLPTQIDYADYRDTGGVKIPYRWTLARPNGRFTIQVSDVQQNVPVDDAKFAKPAPPAEPGKDQRNNVRSLAAIQLASDGRVRPASTGTTVNPHVFSPQ